MTSPLDSTGGCEQAKACFRVFRVMKTIIYIDGFNLYYRLKYTPYRWLNLKKLRNSFKPKTTQYNTNQLFYSKGKGNCR